MTYYINLDRRPDRNLRMQQQLKMRDLVHLRVAACDGQVESYLDTRLLSRGEVACWQSHQRVYSRVSSSEDEFALVLEDDADLPSVNFSQATLGKFALSMREHEIDILQLGFIEHLYSLRNIAATVKTLEDLKSGRKIRLTHGDESVVLGDFRAGTHAYILNKKAATLLLGTNLPTTRAADDFLGDLANGFRSGRQILRIARLSTSQVGQVGRTRLPGILDSDIAGD